MEGEDLAITVLTCEGDIKDPAFPFRLRQLLNKLQKLISDEGNPIKVTKVEPWNSVRITFNIPLEAAQRLRQLAERGDRTLRELGILSVQIEGDQVITLTLASQYSEPQEIVLRKTTDGQDVASISLNLSNSDSLPGPSSAESTHKSLSQFLGHIVGGASAAATNPSGRLEKSASPKLETSLSFRSPNVIAPTSTEPLPFPPSAVITTTAALPSSSRLSPNISLKSAGFGPFPFASMTHAMNTKNSTSPHYQPLLHVQGGSPRLLPPSSQLTNAILSSSPNSVNSPPSVTNSAMQKVPRTVSTSAFNSVSKTISPNAIASTSRANVALSSPLLVNLLQSENSNMQQNNKLMPPPTQSANQATKKKRKPRKMKDKSVDEALSPSFATSPSPPSYASVRSPGSLDHLNALGSSLSVPINSVSPPSNIYPMSQPPVSNVKVSTSTIHPPPQGLPPVSLQSSIQGQPMVSTPRHQAISSAFRQNQGPRAVPNIHPQAQGQPQVHTGNLPLHTHIPVGSLQVQRANTPSYTMSAPRNIPSSTTRSMFVSKDMPAAKVFEKTKEFALIKSDRNSAPSTPDSNPFPSPPSSSDGKTKHLINPFTGQLEPMPSDEEEEEESIGSLPPFPDFEMDTSEKSQSERSLSDSGKDTNLSSDTDSGISKSITDVSQSSSECAATEPRKVDSNPKAEAVPLASVTSSVPGEKIKLRLKLDSKSIRECKDSDKRIKESSLMSSQRVDVNPMSASAMKKNALAPTVPEPRVPPLHISIRGPNAAVVVSPRKDDSKSKHNPNKDDHSITDVPSKGVQKRVRSPRSARPGDIPSRNLESLDKKAKGSNSKEFKKIKDDLWSPNVKMSGGGIVEVSEKLTPTCMPSYDTYLSSVSVSGSLVARKATGIFSLASRDSCKSEVLTLTSCSTGESVTLHSCSEEKQAAKTGNPLPSDTNPSSVISPIERTQHTDSQKPLEECENKSSSFETSPPLQTNHLPHSPSAPLDSKITPVQTSCPSDQTLLQSANSLSLVSTVPLSSHSVSSPTCNTSEAASDSNVQMQESVITDANGLTTPCSVGATLAEDLFTSAESQKLEISQCNTHPVVSNISEPVEIVVNVDKNVQSELETETVHKNSVDGVQISDVNKSPTANNENSASSLSGESKGHDSFTSNSTPVEDVSSTPAVNCNLTVLCSPGKETNEAVLDVNVCTIDPEKVPVAQIITSSKDNSSSQSQVIEVPSSPALRQGGCSAEVDHLSLSDAKDPAETQREKGSLTEDNTDLHASKQKEQLNEDRKRCLLLSEVPTSTPGPPPPPDPCLNSLKLEESRSDDSASLAKAVDTKPCDKDATMQNAFSELQVSASATENSPVSIASPKVSIANPELIVSPEASVHIPAITVLSPKVEPEKTVVMPVTSTPSISPKTIQTDSSPVLQSSSNSTDAGPSLENKISSKAEVKKESPAESIHVVNSAANSLVTSLLSPVKYLQNEVSSQKFKLIFKGSGQKSALPGGNASGSLVVPLNSSKVPIKLVALPGGASALSVRSTSNPNIVEIIGPKTAPNSPSSNPHISSPVRLVVSKMAPVMTCTNPGNSSNMRNRVVVKSVVVTSTSSIKLLSANSLCNTSLSLNTGASSTSTILHSIPSAVISNSIAVPNIIPEDSKAVCATESPPIISSSNSQETNSNASANLAKISAVGSSDSTRKDLGMNPSETKSSIPNSESTEKPGVSSDATFVNVKPVGVSNSLLKEDSVSAASVACPKDAKTPEENKLDKEIVSEKSDTAAVCVSEMPQVSSASTISQNPLDQPQITQKSDFTLVEKNGIESKPASKSDKADTLNPEQTLHSAITSSQCISKSEDVTDSAHSSEPIENDSSHKPLADDSISNNQDASSKMIADPKSTEKQPSLVEGEQKPSADSKDSLDKLEQVAEIGDSDSLDSKLGVINMEKIRPLVEESVGSAESDDTKVLVKDSQLKISLVYSKPLKRKCSENAAELIKACMGVEDCPKRGILLKTKEEDSEKVTEVEKVEENVRMSLRIRRDEPLLKKGKGTTHSDCSTDEEITISELVTKSRTTRDRPTRARISNRDSSVEPINCRPKRRRSGSNESCNSHNSEEIKTRTRENKRETNKKDDSSKKLPERTKRGTFKAQEQVVVAKLGIQRSSRNRDPDVKPNALHNSKEEANSLTAKRKTRNTSEPQEVLVPVKRRRYSKDGHR